MKIGTWLTIACLATRAFALETSDSDAAVMRGAEEINRALSDGRYERVTELTYPLVVSKLGGKEKMIQTLKHGTEEMKSQGVSFQEVTVDVPSAHASTADHRFAVVPFTLRMHVPDGTLLQRSFVIAISADKGATWTFINGDVDPVKLREAIPILPKDLPFPAREKPILQASP